MIVALSNVLMYGALQLLPDGENSALMVGAMLVNLALLLQVALRTPLGLTPGSDLPWFQRATLPLSLLLLCGTVVLSLPVQLDATLGDAQYHALPARTSVTFHLQGGESVLLPMRTEGLACLLHRREVTPVQIDTRTPLHPQVNFRQGAAARAVTGFTLSPAVRLAAERLPAVTAFALPCQSPFPGGNIDDLQTTRRNNVLTIDAAYR